MAVDPGPPAHLGPESEADRTVRHAANLSEQHSQQPKGNPVCRQLYGGPSRPDPGTASPEVGQPPCPVTLHLWLLSLSSFSI